MKTTQKITVFLPFALLQEFAGVCNSEFRTRSEVIRSALRAYFDQTDSGIVPTKGELSHVHEERTAFRRGSSQSLRRFVDQMQSSSTGSSAETILKSAAKRSASVQK